MAAEDGRWLSGRSVPLESVLHSRCRRSGNPGATRPARSPDELLRRTYRSPETAGTEVVTDVSAPRIGVQAHPGPHRTPRQNDDRCQHKSSADRNLRVPSRSAEGRSAWGSTRHAADRRSGAPWSAGAAVGSVIYDEPVIGGAVHSESDVPPRAPTGRGSFAPRPIVSVFAACCKKFS